MAAIGPRAISPGEDVYLALDVAATELYGEDRYFLKGEKRSLTSDQLVAYYAELARQLSDLLDRGRHERGRLGGLGRADRGAWEPAASWSATICS